MARVAPERKKALFSCHNYIFKALQKGSNMSKLKNLTGKPFGRLRVVERAENSKTGETRWKCICSCENKTECIVRATDLQRGRVQSCGCIRKEKLKNNPNGTKHGQKGTRLYTIWCDMKARCYYSKDRNFKNYGGRGITVCDEWKNNFQAFYDWSINNGYQDTLSINRINTDGNYEPSNCNWVTREEQDNNTRRNHFVTYSGKTKTIAQWAKEYNIKYATLHNRIVRLHWSIEKALNTP